MLDKLVNDGIFTSKSDAMRHAIRLLIKDSILIGELVESPGDVITIDGCAYKLVRKKVGVTNG